VLDPEAFFDVAAGVGFAVDVDEAESVGNDSSARLGEDYVGRTMGHVTAGGSMVLDCDRVVEDELRSLHAEYLASLRFEVGAVLARSHRDGTRGASRPRRLAICGMYREISSTKRCR
jgi:hypothetical protein